ncbi:RICIN domain-containing protein [Streptomyces sp. NPDC094049]|uniref:RICIN domain-containing protein n=1 Tax=Streptomyces sp. NPDC094049 TaxID=3154987 RepID=UPI00331AF69F
MHNTCRCLRAFLRRGGGAARTSTARRGPVRVLRPPTVLDSGPLPTGSLALTGPGTARAAGERVDVRLTTRSGPGGHTVTRGLAPQSPIACGPADGTTYLALTVTVTVTVDESVTRQRFEGGGVSITDTTAPLRRDHRPSRSTPAGGDHARVLGRCLDVTGGSTADGTRVRLYNCNGTAAQHRRYDPATHDVVRTGADECLDVTGGPSADGTRAQLRNRTGGTHLKGTHHP